MVVVRHLVTRLQCWHKLVLRFRSNPTRLDYRTLRNLTVVGLDCRPYRRRPSMSLPKFTPTENHSFLTLDKSIRLLSSLITSKKWDGGEGTNKFHFFFFRELTKNLMCVHPATDTDIKSYLFVPFVILAKTTPLRNLPLLWRHPSRPCPATIHLTMEEFRAELYNSRQFHYKLASTMVHTSSPLYNYVPHTTPVPFPSLPSFYSSLLFVY